MATCISEPAATTPTAASSAPHPAVCGDATLSVRNECSGVTWVAIVRTSRGPGARSSSAAAPLVLTPGQSHTFTLATLAPDLAPPADMGTRYYPLVAAIKRQVLFVSVTTVALKAAYAGSVTAAALAAAPADSTSVLDTAADWSTLVTSTFYASTCGATGLSSPIATASGTVEMPHAGVSVVPLAATANSSTQLSLALAQYQPHVFVPSASLEDADQRQHSTAVVLVVVLVLVIAITTALIVLGARHWHLRAKLALHQAHFDLHNTLEHHHHGGVARQ